MGVFVYRCKDKKKYNVELDELLVGVANNAANNYKDAAQQNYKKFVEEFERLKVAGKLNEKQLAYYDGMKVKYEQELKGFHH